MFSKSKFSKASLFLLLAIFIFFFSLIPRSAELFTKNYFFTYDQGMDYMAVKKIVVDHKLTLIGPAVGAGYAGVGGLFQGPFYYYSLAIPFLMTNGDPYSGVVLMFIASLFAILFSFYFGKKAFGLWGGLLMALFFAMAPIFSRQAGYVWSSQQSTPFLVLAFYFIYLINSRRSFLIIFLASFFSGFVYNFEIANAIPLSIALFIYCAFIFRSKLKYYIPLLSGYIVAFSPMILFNIKHSTLLINGILSYFSTKKQNPDLSIFYYLPDHLNTFKYNFLDTFSRPNNYLILLFGIIVLILTVYYYVRDKNKNIKIFFKFLILLPVANLIVFSFLRNPIYSYYLLDLNVVYIFVIVYVMMRSFIDHVFLFRYVVLVIFIVLLFSGVYQTSENFMHNLNDYGGRARIRGKLNAIDYIYKDAKGQRFGFLAFSSAVYSDDTDYLLWWYGQRKYGYMPYRAKRGMVYLFIDKDDDHPYTYKGWLETVIKKGKVISTVILPKSGIIIQKREFN